MDLNSPLFDRIRAGRTEQPPQRDDVRPRCDAPGCAEPGQFRAPMGRLREGQYFCFCLDHVREYNHSYNYFNGMTDEAVARYLKDASVGHRPTWTMGARRGAGDAFYARPNDPLSAYRARYARSRAGQPPTPRYSPVTMRALEALGLDDSADAQTIRTRYKELVKRHHPDANGGDRSREEKLREIIHAYKTLRAARLA